MTMKLQVRQTALKANSHEHAERRLQIALGRHHDRVGHVSVRLEKENVRHKCRILVSLRKPDASGPRLNDRYARPLSSTRMIVVEATSDELFEAIDLAAERAAARVTKECERAQDRPSERISKRLLEEDNDEGHRVA
jgi:ribosomal subunit interface protein